jgi:hypothetical protein
MEELNIEEMIALTGGGHHHKQPSTEIEVGSISVNQSNTAYQSNSSSISVG